MPVVSSSTLNTSLYSWQLSWIHYPVLPCTDPASLIFPEGRRGSVHRLAGGQYTIRKEKMFVTLTNRIDQKQTTAAENKLFALKKYVTRNNSPELPVDGNIIGQISISRIVILKKKRKTNFSHLCYWTAQRQQRQERKKIAKSFPAWPCICMNLRSGRHFGAFIDLILVP